MKKSINVIELFAGVGAPIMALKKLGYKINHIAAVEFDKHAMKSYNAIHNTEFEPRDIYEYDFEGISQEIDFLHMSPPCTKFSVQGKGGGDKDEETTDLWKQCLHIINLTQPNVVSFENVKSVSKANVFVNLCEFMELLGYSKVYDGVLNAKHFGLAQNRERLYVVWVKGEHNLIDIDIWKEKEEGDIIPKFKNETVTLWDIMNFKHPSKRVEKKVLFDNIVDAHNFKFIYDSDQQRNKVIIGDDLELFDPKPHRTKIYTGYITQQYDINLPFDAYKRLKFNSDSHFLGINGISGTICAKSYAGFQNKVMWRDPDGFVHYRNLETDELGRLQGFRDEDTNKMLSVCSKAQVNKQIGNSIAVNVLEELYSQVDFKVERFSDEENGTNDYRYYTKYSPIKLEGERRLCRVCGCYFKPNVQRQEYCSVGHCGSETCDNGYCKKNLIPDTNNDLKLCVAVKHKNNLHFCNEECMSRYFKITIKKWCQND